MRNAAEITRQCQAILALLSDGKEHESKQLSERAGFIPSATLAWRLVELRALGHDIRKVKDVRDWKRKAHVVEYQIF